MPHHRCISILFANYFGINSLQTGTEFILVCAGKDCQGLELPPGVRGKGIKGRGQGTQLVTPEKPLPLPGVSRVFLLPNF